MSDIIGHIHCYRGDPLRCDCGETPYTVEAALRAERDGMVEALREARRYLDAGDEKPHPLLWMIDAALSWTGKRQ